MARTVAVQYIGPSSGVQVPGLGITAERGVPCKVGAAAAGRAPGPWRAVTAEDPDWWPRRLDPADQETTQTRDPGEGLLAQEDVWVAVVSGSGSAEQQEG